MFFEICEKLLLKNWLIYILHVCSSTDSYVREICQCHPMKTAVKLQGSTLLQSAAVHSQFHTTHPSPVSLVRRAPLLVRQPTSSFITTPQIFSAIQWIFILKNTCLYSFCANYAAKHGGTFPYMCNSPKANTFHRVPCEKLNTHVKQHG